MTREWNGSLVMEEFAKIAADSGLITTDFGKPVVGNPDKETPVKDHRRHEPGKEYGVTKETGEDLIGKAHPKDAKPAEAMGDGALVENIVQQQEKDIEVATRMPSGALVGKHAELVNGLVALANDLEGMGKTDVAARIDQTIERLAAIPFGEGLYKEAFFTTLLAPLKWLFWGGATGAAAWKFGPDVLSKLTSYRETLAQDIQDVLEGAASVRQDDTSLSAVEGKLRTLLSPYVSKFRKPIPVPGDETGLREYLSVMESFGSALPDIRELVTALTTARGGWLEGIGLGPKSRLAEKFKDMVGTFQDTLKMVQAVAKVGKEQMPPEAAKAEPSIPTSINELQKLLAENGFKVSQTGKLDDATKAALRKMEQQLDNDLRRKPNLARILDAEGWGIAGLLLRPDGTVTDPSILRRLLRLAYGDKDK